LTHYPDLDLFYVDQPMAEIPLYEFASEHWFAMVETQFRERVQAALARDPHLKLAFSLCEVFTDPPAHIGRGAVGWSVRMQAGQFEFFARELGGMQHKVIARYDDIQPLVRFRVGGDVERAKHYASLGEALARTGRVRVVGTLPPLPREFATLHDAVAERTL